MLFRRGRRQVEETNPDMKFLHDIRQETEGLSALLDDLEKQVESGNYNPSGITTLPLYSLLRIEGVIYRRLSKTLGEKVAKAFIEDTRSKYQSSS